MNKRMIKCVMAASAIAVCAVFSGCGKEDAQVETTEAMTQVETTVTDEATISSELQEALDNGWIVDDWTEETEAPQETVSQTGNTEATEPEKTEPNGTEPQVTEPEEVTPQVTEPEETEPQATEPEETKPQEDKPQSGGTAYEQYLSMSAKDQQAFYESFESVDAYFAWLNSAKAEYEKNQNSTELEGGSVDIGDLMGGEGE